MGCASAGWQEYRRETTQTPHVVPVLEGSRPKPLDRVRHTIRMPAPQPADSVARAFRRQYDLSPRAGAWCAGRDESSGPAVSGYARVSRHNHRSTDRPITVEVHRGDSLRGIRLSPVLRGYAPVSARNHARGPFGEGLGDDLRAIITSGGGGIAGRIAFDSGVDPLDRRIDPLDSIH